MRLVWMAAKKNEKKKGSQLKLSSSEMKGLKAYKDNYKEGVAEVHKAIKEDMEFYGLEVYKQVGLSFASEA